MLFVASTQIRSLHPSGSMVAPPGGGESPGPRARGRGAGPTARGRGGQSPPSPPARPITTPPNRPTKSNPTTTTRGPWPGAIGGTEGRGGEGTGEEGGAGPDHRRSHEALHRRDRTKQLPPWAARVAPAPNIAKSGAEIIFLKRTAVRRPKKAISIFFR